MNLAERILTLYPNAVIGPDKPADVVLSMRGNAAQIEYWNASTLGPEPAMSDLMKVTPQQIAATRARMESDAALGGPLRAVIKWIASLHGISEADAVEAVKSRL